MPDTYAAPATTFPEFTTMPSQESFRQTAENTGELLRSYFSQLDSEDKEVTEARKILGDLADELTADELKEIVTEVKYLTTCWLDEFEKSIFKGKTVAEILHEKGAYVKRR